MSETLRNQVQAVVDHLKAKHAQEAAQKALQAPPKPAPIPPPMPTLEDYQKALAAHDWYYDYSDDHRVWKQGLAQRDRIREMQRVLDPDYQVWNRYAPQDCRVGLL